MKQLRRFLTLLLVFGLWAPPSMAAQNFFEGLSFGQSKEAVIKTLEKKYQFMQEEAQGRGVIFEGEILNQKGLILTVFNYQLQLSAIKLLFDVNHQNFNQLYRNQVYYSGLLCRKYGSPRVSRRRFEPPYQLGDGKELNAIREGKAQIVSVWDAQGTKIFCGLDDFKKLMGPSVFIEYGDPDQIKNLVSP